MKATIVALALIAGLACVQAAGGIKGRQPEESQQRIQAVKGLRPPAQQQQYLPPPPPPQPIALLPPPPPPQQAIKAGPGQVAPVFSAVRVQPAPQQQQQIQTDAQTLRRAQTNVRNRQPPPPPPRGQLATSTMTTCLRATTLRGLCGASGRLRCARWKTLAGRLMNSVARPSLRSRRVVSPSFSQKFSPRRSHAVARAPIRANGKTVCGAQSSPAESLDKARLARPVRSSQFFGPFIFHARSATAVRGRAPSASFNKRHACVDLNPSRTGCNRACLLCARAASGLVTKLNTKNQCLLTDDRARAAHERELDLSCHANHDPPTGPLELLLFMIAGWRVLRNRPTVWLAACACCATRPPRFAHRNLCVPFREGEDGRDRRVDYVADASGFRATVRSNEMGTADKDSADVDWQVQAPSEGQLRAAEAATQAARQRAALAPPPQQLQPIASASSQSASKFSSPRQRGSASTQQLSKTNAPQQQQQQQQQVAQQAQISQQLQEPFEQIRQSELSTRARKSRHAPFYLFTV
ncbi:Hypothetical predicted protein [Olea europaea subsp. europaea]|uniref:Uncharacterized protein n=1 Tax=Olea europaea subsp. europaea TaxID=158383 RepID=A0A8S0TRB3_OLEEU|nr:Hypothetical predicted protein [Olea europaea subsp. europaea]